MLQSQKLGEETLSEREPKRAAICVRDRATACSKSAMNLVERLTDDVRKNKEWLLESLQYPLAPARSRR